MSFNIFQAVSPPLVYSEVLQHASGGFHWTVSSCSPALPFWKPIQRRNKDTM